MALENQLAEVEVVGKYGALFSHGQREDRLVVCPWGQLNTPDHVMTCFSQPLNKGCFDIGICEELHAVLPGAQIVLSNDK